MKTSRPHARLIGSLEGSGRLYAITQLSRSRQGRAPAARTGNGVYYGMAHALIILCIYYRVVATTQVHLCCAAPLRTRTYRWRYDRADRGVGSCPLGARAPSRALPCVYLLRSRGRHGSNYHGMGQQRAPRYGTLSESECVRLHASCMHILHASCQGGGLFAPICLACTTCMHLAKVVACSRQSVSDATRPESSRFVRKARGRRLSSSDERPHHPVERLHHPLIGPSACRW